MLRVTLQYSANEEPRLVQEGNDRAILKQIALRLARKVNGVIQPRLDGYNVLAVKNEPEPGERLQYDLGDRVRVLGTGNLGTVIGYEFGNTFLVKLDEPATELVENEESQYVWYYGYALEEA